SKSPMSTPSNSSIAIKSSTRSCDSRGKVKSAHASLSFMALFLELIPFPLCLEGRMFENFRVEHAARFLAKGQIDHYLAGGPAHVTKHFARPGNGVRRE